MCKPCSREWISYKLRSSHCLVADVQQIDDVGLCSKWIQHSSVRYKNLHLFGINITAITIVISKSEMASNILQAIFVCITAIGIVYVTQPYCVDLVNLAKNILIDRQDEMEKTIYSAWEDIISNREKAGFHSIAIG